MVESQDQCVSQRNSYLQKLTFLGENRREVNVKEMTQYQTTVVVAGEGGVLSVDTHDLKPILTEIRVVKMVNEAPKTIERFARNRLRGRLKYPLGHVRDEREICHGFTEHLTPNYFLVLQKSNGK
jgi:hypothetical protein